VTVSGDIDFRNETLDLSLEPRLKQGINVDLAQIASMVRYRGPFRDAKVSIDSMASVATLARVGAAVETGGLSLLGETLFRSAGSAPSPCAVAMGNASATKAPDSAARSSPNTDNPATAIGKALGRLLSH